MIDTQLFCKALKFAAHAASKKDVRYYLNGVRVEYEDDVLTLVGTDGNRLAHVALRTSLMSATPVAAMIGNDDIKRVLATFGKDKGEVSLVIEVPADPAQQPKVRVTAAGTTLDIVGLEGRYPDWRRILPPSTRTVGTMPHLCAQQLADACSALQPFIDPYKKVFALCILPGAGELDVVLLKPARANYYPRVIDCQVVIAPLRK
jgi:DNA polymerase III sliding clamp (beta) subunit (PCNA family)